MLDQRCENVFDDLIVRHDCLTVLQTRNSRLPRWNTACQRKNASSARDRMRGRQARAGRRSVPVMRRKGEDTFSMKRRRASTSPSRAGARMRASCCSTSRPGRRRAPCSTGSTAAASRTARCRCPSMGRNRRVQRVQPAGATEHFFATAASHDCHTTGIVTRQDCRHGSYFPIRFLGGHDGEAPK